MGKQANIPKAIVTMFAKREVTSANISQDIPLWIGSFFYIIFWWMNTYWISRLGSEAIATVAIGGCGLMLFWTVLIAVSNATIAMVGNLAGRKDFEGTNQLAKEILTITFLVCLILAITGYLVTPGLLGLLKAKSEVLVLAIAYLDSYGWRHS